MTEKSPGFFQANDGAPVGTQTNTGGFQSGTQRHTGTQDGTIQNTATFASPSPATVTPSSPTPITEVVGDNTPSFANNAVDLGDRVSYNPGTRTLTVNGTNYVLDDGDAVSYDPSTNVLTINGTTYDIAGGDTVSYNPVNRELIINGVGYSLDDTDTTYTLSLSGSSLTLTGSDGSTDVEDLSSVVNVPAYTLTFTESTEVLNLLRDGSVVSSIDLTDTEIDTTYTLGRSGTSLTLTDNLGSVQTIDSVGTVSLTFDDDSRVLTATVDGKTSRVTIPGGSGGGGGTDVRSRLERALSGLRDNRTVRRFAPQDDEGFYTTATYTIDNDNTATRTFVYNRGGNGELTQDYYRGSFIDTFTEGNENALIKDWTYEDAAAGFGGGFTDTGYYFGRITGDASGVSFLAGEFIDPDGALSFTAGEFTLPDDIMFTAGEFSGDGITTQP